MQITVRVWLDRIKGDVLVFLGMSPVIFAVKESPVGLENMLNTIAKGGDETGATAFKIQIAFYQAIIDPG